MLISGELPALHFVLHLAGALHLGGLDQGTARLPIRPEPRSFRRFRRPAGHQRVGLGRHQLSTRRPGRQGLIGRTSRAAAQNQGREKNAKPIRELDGANSGRVIKLEVKAERPEDLDTVQPFLDFPVAAIRSPPIRVERNNLIRISVLVKRMFPSAMGCRRSHRARLDRRRAVPVPHERPHPEFTRVLLFRKAPADGTFRSRWGSRATARRSSTTCGSKSSSRTTAPRRRTWSSETSRPGPCEHPGRRTRHHRRPLARPTGGDRQPR